MIDVDMVAGQIGGIADAHTVLADELKALGRADLALAAALLGAEHRRLQRKARTLDEIVADSAEDERMAEHVARIPQRRRFVPTVVIGGRI